MAGIIFGVLVGIMVTAQDIGLIIPFYTKIDITVPGTSTLSWEYTSAGVSITGASNSITQITIPSQLHDLRINSKQLPMVSVTRIGTNAFLNHTQLTQITIPSNVTHIGKNAFQNTNNASIYLNGRSSVSSTFDINWNSSANPVYLNGIICNHSSKTRIEINSTHHGDLCNTCRTIINKATHRTYTSGGWVYCHDCSYSKYVGHTHTYSGPYIPAGDAGHLATCSCGATSVQAHIAGLHESGDRYVNCMRCGYLIDLWTGGPIIIMRNNHTHEGECEHIHDNDDSLFIDYVINIDIINNPVAIIQKEEEFYQK
jgi:hypothetical protein